MIIAVFQVKYKYQIYILCTKNPYFLVWMNLSKTFISLAFVMHIEKSRDLSIIAFQKWYWKTINHGDLRSHTTMTMRGFLTSIEK